MRTTILALGVAVATLAASGPAAAGGCRTCGSAGFFPRSEWHHFTTPKVFTVPYGSKSSTTAVPCGGAAPCGPQVVTPAGFRPASTCGWCR